MKPVQLLPLFVCALLAGWLAPGLTVASDEPNAAHDSESVASEPTDSAQNKAAWLAGETVLNRESDGHFYADAYVEGSRYRFLVDTGASMVALTGRDAQAMGLEWDEASLRPIGRGASGTVHGVTVTIASMEVGGIEARDVHGAIIPDGLDVSLLGQSFLSQVSNVEISGDEMRLGG